VLHVGYRRLFRPAFSLKVQICYYSNEALDSPRFCGAYAQKMVNVLSPGDFVIMQNNYALPGKGVIQATDLHVMDTSEKSVVLTKSNKPCQDDKSHQPNISLFGMK